MIHQFTGRPLLILFIALGILFFLFWYRGSGGVLTDNEIDNYLQAFDDLPEESLAFLDVENTRQFLLDDDGEAFYMVNLFKFRTVAQDPESEADTVSGAQLFNRFTRKVLPIWITKAGHPVLASPISDTVFGDWDMVSVVRYRSRRDFIESQVDPDYLAALPLRIAATEDNERLKLPANSIPLPIALVLLCVGLLAYLIGMSLLNRKRKDASRLDNSRLRSGAVSL